MSERIYLDGLEEDPHFKNAKETLKEYMRSAIPLDASKAYQAYIIADVLAELAAELNMSVTFHANKKGVHVMIDMNVWETPYGDHLGRGDEDGVYTWNVEARFDA